MKIFLTGATGILGTDIERELKSRGVEVLGFGSNGIRLDRAEEVGKQVFNFNPEVIIHAAAMTNVDGCEADKETAFRINVVGTENMALCAARLNIPLVYISSCGVYGNGSKNPYSETDNTSPLNYHHVTKLEGERRVKENLSNYLIVRPGWLFGGSPYHKKNFVEARRKEALSNYELQSADDKFGSPTYTLDLARQIITLLTAGKTGTFNAVNTGFASRFDYVSAIVEAFHFTNRMLPVKSNAFPRPAMMPDNEMLENAHLNSLGLNSMRHWKDALHSYIDSAYGSLTHDSEIRAALR